MATFDTNTMSILIAALMGFIIIGINSLVLKFLSKKLNFKITEYKTALIVAIVASVINASLNQLTTMAQLSIAYTLILSIINLFIGIALIRLIYKEEWKNSAKAGILWWVISLVIAFVLALLIAIPALYMMGVFSGSYTAAESCPNCPPCTYCFRQFAYVSHAYEGSYLKLELRTGPEEISALSCVSPQGCSVNTSQVSFNKNFLIKIPKVSDSNQTVVLSYKKSSEQFASEHTQTIDAKFFGN